MANGKCETLRDSETSVFLCEPETFWLFRLRDRDFKVFWERAPDVHTGMADPDLELRGGREGGARPVLFYLPCWLFGFLLWNNNMNFPLTRAQVVFFETAANLWASRRKANDFSQFFFSFELGGITKHLMTDPAGNSEKTLSFQTSWLISRCLL